MHGGRLIFVIVLGFGRNASGYYVFDCEGRPRPVEASRDRERHIIGLEIEPLFRAFHYGLISLDLLGNARRCGLDVEEYGSFNADEIVLVVRYQRQLHR